MSADSHDRYGKELLASILGGRWRSRLDDERSFSMGGVRADLDGIIRSADMGTVECAVEIEARVYKQIRGAILDLAWHPAPRKLLVIIRAQEQLGSEDKVRAHCSYVWKRLAGDDRSPFRLVLLKGTGSIPCHDEDRASLITALTELELIRPEGA